MSGRVIKKYRVDHHSKCMVCETEWSGINAQAVAFKHAKHHRHQTICDTEIIWSYTPEEQRGE